MKSAFVVGLPFTIPILANPLLKKSWLVITDNDVFDNTDFSMTLSMAAPSSSIESFSIETSGTTPSVITTQTPTASASAAATSTTIASNSSGTLDSYSQSILDQHNRHRQNNTAQPLEWSDSMANIAAQIASSCVYAHNTAAGGGGYGQNIGAGAEPSEVPALITNSMYNDEIGWYPTPYGNDNPDMTNFEKWGHYSQIVWASTTAVGCATQYCPNGLANTGSNVSPYFTVCNYSPPGNFAGQYSNVHAPDGGVDNTVLT